MHFITTLPNPGQIIGRVQLLADIHTALRQGRPVALVHGIGGIGKTTAAAAYAHHPEYSADYEAVCWLEVTSSISAAFVSARALQQYLGVEERVERALLTPTFDNSPRELAAFTEVVEALRQCPARLLLLLDNANDEAEIRQIVPALQAPELRVLVTSRADCEDLQPIRVEALPPEEAVELFWRYYDPTGLTPDPSPKGEERRDIHQDTAYVSEAIPEHAASPLSIRRGAGGEAFDLLASFDYHTLLTEMLAKIGRGAGYTLPELLAHVRDLTLREEKWQIPVGTGLSGRTHRMGKETLKTYLTHLFREIKTLREEDTALLRRLAALPNRGHSTEQLAALLRLEGDAIFALRRQLAALDQQGIPLRDGKSWRLHPLFREVCLDVLAPFTAENCAPLVEVVAEMVLLNSETKNWKEKIENQGYAEELLDLLREENSPEVSALQNNLAMGYLPLDRYQEAKILFEKALYSDLENLGEKHHRVAICRSNLSTVLKDLGDLLGAKDQAELALASDLENFGEPHPSVSIKRVALAYVLQSLGNLSGAKEQLQLALASGLENFGERHPNVATYRSNLSSVLQDLGDLFGAREQLELALSSDLENFGATHPKISIYRSNLANVLKDLGDLSGAKEQLELALASDLENFGAQNTSVARCKNNLAYVLEALGEPEAALHLWQEALAVRRVVLGKEHPHTQNVLRTLRNRGAL